MSLIKSDDHAPLLGKQQKQKHEKKKKKLFETYVRSASLSGSFEADSSEDLIRQKLQWYFRNPYEKYKERKRKPIKLILQIIKIILVTVQVFSISFYDFGLFHLITIQGQTFSALIFLVQKMFIPPGKI